MKAKDIFGISVLIAFLGVVATQGQIVTNESLQVEITAAGNAPIEISPFNMPPMQYDMAEFQLNCNNKTLAPIIATVFCDLVFLKDPAITDEGKGVKDIHDALSFHNLDLPPGISTCTVVFSTFNVSLKGEGKMKIYLTERINPTPPPPRIWFLAAKSEVATLDKPFDQVYEQLQLHQISNTLLLPAKMKE